MDETPSQMRELNLAKNLHSPRLSLSNQLASMRPERSVVALFPKSHPILFFRILMMDLLIKTFKIPR
jgi:hypothetical protein